MEKKSDPRNYSVDFSELKDMGFQTEKSHQGSSTMNEMTYIRAHYCEKYQICIENSKNFPYFEKVFNSKLTKTQITDSKQSENRQPSVFSTVPFGDKMPSKFQMKVISNL